MIRRLFLFAVLITALVACDSESKSAENNSKEETTSTATEGETFGKAITASNAISYDDLTQKMQSTDSLAVKVKGTVQAVCQAKGCWMNISAPGSNSEEMMVQFEDYKFFVPKDISGREVIMEGYAYRNVTPVDELRHFAKDEGKSQAEIDAITEPKEELKFLASGVLLLEEGE